MTPEQHPSPPHDPNPDLSEHALRLLLTGDPLPNIADTLGIPLTHLLAWARSEIGRYHLETLAQLLRARAALIADDARPAAIDALGAIVAHPRDDTERRRAATTLARETRATAKRTPPRARPAEEDARDAASREAEDAPAPDLAEDAHAADPDLARADAPPAPPQAHTIRDAHPSDTHAVGPA